MLGQRTQLVLFLSLATSCIGGNPLPGAPLGTFTTTGGIRTNSCGAGLALRNSWKSDIELSREGNLLRWREAGSGTTLSGGLDANNKASLRASNSVQVRTDAGSVTCTYSSTTRIDVSLDHGEVPSKLTGTLEVAFRVDAGDCTSVLAVAGGKFDSLPCSVDYTLSGTKTSAAR